jgi:glutathione S-transferase
VPVDIFAGDTLTDAYAAINPLRETPVLELDSGERIAQSSAILWYLASGTPFLPESALERAWVVSWLSFEQERIMGGIGNPRFRLLTGRDRSSVEARLATGRGALSVLDAHLVGRSFVVGASPSIADLGLFPYISVAGDAGLDLSEWPQVSAWLDRIRTLDGFVDDFVTYPPNARPGAGESIY